ncbi:DUF956 family protein [Lactococcus fujiensis]|uniref:DUF956 family protein n=1 Tax=Lactococcus fujiensis TaxID=610251 RepID=UPI0035715A7C
MGKSWLETKQSNFFDKRSVENNMQFPWKSILRVEGEVSRAFRGKKENRSSIFYRSSKWKKSTFFIKRNRQNFKNFT